MQTQSETGQVRLPFFGIFAVLPYTRPYRAEMAGMVILGCLSSLFDSIYPLFNRYALDHFVVVGTLDTALLFVGLYVTLLAVQALMNYVSTYLCSKVELYVGRDLKNEVFHHVQTLSFSYFNTNSVGYIHARIMSDTDRIGTMVSWRLMDFVWNFSYIVFIFVVMALVNLRLALILLALIPVSTVLISFFQKRLVKLNRQIRELNSRITGNFNEGITGAATIKDLVAEESIGREFEETTGKMRRTSIKAAHYSSLFAATVTFLSSLALSLVLWQGGTLTKEGIIRIGTLSVFLSFAIGLIEPVQNLIEMLSNIIGIQANIERFSTLLKTQSEVKDTAEVIERYGTVFEPKKENWEKIKGHVAFEDVSFHYPDGTEMVLEHFSLDVPKGTNVAIVGETGAGKSTLVNLACRFYEPTQGRVLVDGKDVRERSVLWLHSNIGYVLQSPHLFSGSIRDNIRYGKMEASDDQIWEALSLVQADEIVRRMGDGLDSQVGEGGSLLSTGEKQLISIARALIADPAILVLDEATSSIDTVTEKKLQEAILTLIKGRTSFVIAHRLSTIVEADVILVVTEGRISERGTHEELMKRKGDYYQLFTKQYEDQMTKEVF